MVRLIGLRSLFKGFFVDMIVKLNKNILVKQLFKQNLNNDNIIQYVNIDRESFMGFFFLEKE